MTPDAFDASSDSSPDTAEMDAGVDSNTPDAAPDTMVCVPSGDEVCDGSVDENCDGVVDEGCCTAGETRSCGSDVGACVTGLETCEAGGIWSTCAGSTPPAPEVCNGLDDDCDGAVDDEVTDAGSACGADTGACAAGVETCVGGSLTCVGAITPIAETCNGSDDDCDGTTDEGNPGGGATCGTSSVGRCELGAMTCTAGALACVGAVDARTERCDGIDDDCDGVTDEGVLITFYRDGDGDGFGSTPLDACSMPSGYVSMGGDCDDGDADAFPGQTAFFSSSRSSGGFDYDCSGTATVETGSFSGSCGSTLFTCDGRGYTGSVPACGASGSVRRCRWVIGGGCSDTTTTVTQRCR